MPSYHTISSFSQRTLHSPVFHFISYLTDHQIQIHKKKMRKVSLYLISQLLYTLSQRQLLRLSALFFPNNMEGYKRTTTRFGHLCSSTKNKQKKKRNKIQPYNRKFVFKQFIKSLKVHYYSNPCEKLVENLRRNGTMIHTFRKSKDCRQYISSIPSEP